MVQDLKMKLIVTAITLIRDLRWLKQIVSNGNLLEQMANTSEKKILGSSKLFF